MACLARTICNVLQCTGILCTWLLDAMRFLRLCLRPEAALAAENLFLHKQLVLYQAHHVKPRRATNATRFTLVWLSQWFDWQPALGWCSRRRSSGGGAKGVNCSGVGRHILDAHQSWWNCKSSSSRWGATT
jgi:hypothetical protein